MDKILVIDLGGQYAHLIANRFRRMGYLSDICLPEDSLFIARDPHVKGIVLSGGPGSVYDDCSVDVSTEIFNLKKPILGICYGHQLIAKHMGGEVQSGDTKEYGFAEIEISQSSLFNGLKNMQAVWMSHGDQVIELPSGFSVIAKTNDCPISAMQRNHIFGLQFHPEVTHTKSGNQILENFAKICECKKSWSVKAYKEEIIEYVLKNAKGKNVFVLVSGGVDSLVLFVLLNNVLGTERVKALHVDNGLMRFNESRDVMQSLKDMGLGNIDFVDESDRFLTALHEVVAPEKKREIIGDLFVDIAEEHLSQIMTSDNWLIGQGTIYPDTIESKGTKNSDLIKTHHNRVPKMQELIEKGLVIEPLSHLYKDEVRSLGKELGIPHDLLQRHPFPGPGLGVRILCNSAEESELSCENKSLKDIFSQAHILSLKSVGVQGDKRTYAHPAVIPFLEWKEMQSISTQITNSMVSVNRVLFCVGGNARKLKIAYMTKERVQLLQKADHEVNKLLKEAKYYDVVWQMPVVLVPLSGTGGESIILRPVDSQEAMTAKFSRLPFVLVNRIAQQLLKIQGIDAVFYDITNKPPGTIEWE